VWFGPLSCCGDKISLALNSGLGSYGGSSDAEAEAEKSSEMATNVVIEIMMYGPF
jgi:hypothetical protein